MQRFARKMLHQVRLLRFLGLGGYRSYRVAATGREVSLTLNDRKIIVRKGTPDLDVAFSCFSGEFEGLRYLLPSNYGGVIVDAGGYIGTASLALRELFPNAKLVVIEPSEENIKVLRKNLRGIENLEIFHGALVGKSVGSITLKNRGTGEWGFTAVEKPKDNGNTEFAHNAPAFTLSELVDSIENIGILKLDIEGGEVDLFQHDAGTLEDIKVVFVELHDWIIDGCSEMFFDYSKSRHVVKLAGEKYLSIRAET